MQATSKRTVAGSIVRHGFLPLIAIGGGSAIIAFARQSRIAVAAVVVAVVAVAFAAERIEAFQDEWNRSHRDRFRDVAHALVNEGVIGASLFALPLLTARTPTVADWPSRLPFVLQVSCAVLILDAGVTLVHWWSHRAHALWRFHAVHHSAVRLYGLNGLMKHPVHQLVETAAGMLPLVLLGVPDEVAVALAALVAIQLLLQHSNVAYCAGPLRRWLALNEGHRLHHVARVPEGDVNFGLFTLFWDRLLGSYRDPTGTTVVAGEVGIAGRDDYPVTYVRQLAEPFRRAANA